MTTIEQEIQRLKDIFIRADLSNNIRDISESERAKIRELYDKVEKHYNATLSADFRTFFMTVQPDYEAFVVEGYKFDNYTPFSDTAFERWQELYDMHRDLPYSNPDYDDRMQPFHIHKQWIPFAGYDEGDLFFDAAPTEKGNYGQIIGVYQDFITVEWLAPDFTTFLKQSNDWIEKNWDEYTE